MTNEEMIRILGRQLNRMDLHAANNMASFSCGEIGAVNSGILSLIREIRLLREEARLTSGRVVLKGDRFYLVEWIDHEGILRQKECLTMEEARQEADALRLSYKGVEAFEIGRRE